MRWFKWFGLAPLFLCGAAWAGAFTVSPVRVEIVQPRKAASLEVENNGSEPAQIQVERFVWSRAGNGTDALEPTADFIVTPPIVTLQPGQRQILRVMFLKAPDPRREATYRLILQETPLNDPPPNTVTTLLRLSLPVFLTPPGARSDLNWQRSAHGLAVENRGVAHAFVQAVRAPDGTSLPVNGYVLPGERREWKLDGPLPAAASIQLRDGSESTVRLAP